MTTATAGGECIDENAALALVDGALSSAARAIVERHLASCDACRRLVAELARGFAEDVPPPPDTEPRPHAGAMAVIHGGRYRVDAEIGSGSAGTVYRAHDERTREIVALKIVTDPALAHRFTREATTLARLSHPAIVRYIAHGQTQGGGMYLAMEWLEGEDLEQRLRRGPLGWKNARVLGLRLGEALEHAHALGLVHRDLSPRNVYLPGGRLEDAKLLDFGLVRLPDTHLLDRTGSKAILGTPYYMAPEQVRDPQRVDSRADLFGLGVLLYEMACGRRPFDGVDLFTLWVNIVDAAPPDLRTLVPDAPSAFLAVVEALLAKDPDARPVSAAYVGSALARIDVALAPTAPIAPPLHRPASFPVGSAMPVVTLPAYLPPSAPPWSAPPARTSPPPPMRPAPEPTAGVGAGIFMAAGAGIMGLLAATVFLAYAATHRSSTPAHPPGRNAPSAREPATADEPAPPVVTSVSATPTATTPPSSASRPSKIAPRRLFCGGDQKMTERSGTYVPETTPEEAAVFAGGDCQLVLESCTIQGTTSLLVGYRASVTLRSCQVNGAVDVLGPGATLILEGTTISGRLHNNGGHVVVR